MSIHYAHLPCRKYAKTACGHVFDAMRAGECLTNDTASIDCPECVESDEFKAELMEQALILTKPLSVLRQFGRTKLTT